MSDEQNKRGARIIGYPIIPPEIVNFYTAAKWASLIEVELGNSLGDRDAGRL
jgi:hypothetical protein